MKDLQAHARARSSLMSIAPLTMIMGMERSGTTALLRSLARDPRLSSFSEGEGPLYSGLYLRPETASRRFLEQRVGPILTKPLNETRIRTVTDVLDEFAAYDPRLIWTYRDPVNVYQSWIVQGWTVEPLLPFFLQEWNGRSRRLLTALDTHGGQITLIRYEDLILDAGVWRNVCARVWIEGESLFRPDSRAGRRLVPPSIQDAIDAATADVWQALDDARTFRPRVSRLLMSRYGRTLMRDERRRRVLGRSARAKGPEGEASRGAGGAGLLPDQVASLCLWLDAGTLAPVANGSAVIEWRARSGATALSGPGRSGARLATSAVQGRPSVFFPPGPAEDPDAAPGGFVCGVENDWRFLFDGSEWTIIAVYRPLGRSGPFPAHALLQAGNDSGGEFGLGVTAWGADISAISSSEPSAQGQASALPIVVATPLRAPERPDAWRIATTVHHRQGTPPSAGMAISSYQGHRLQGTGAADPSRGYPRGDASSGLHIGYTPSLTASAFSGDLAELIVFKSALDERSRTAVVHYLGEKYGLA